MTDLQTPCWPPAPQTEQAAALDRIFLREMRGQDRHWLDDCTLPELADEVVGLVRETAVA